MNRRVRARGLQRKFPVPSRQFPERERLILQRHVAYATCRCNIGIEFEFSSLFSIPMAIPMPTRAAGAAARAPRFFSPWRPGISPMGNRLGIGIEWKPSPPAADGAHSSPTPTALRLLAQGWPRNEAYPGSTSHTPSNRNAVVAWRKPASSLGAGERRPLLGGRHPTFQCHPVRHTHQRIIATEVA
jgi:hypothetical protein